MGSSKATGFCCHPPPACWLSELRHRSHLRVGLDHTHPHGSSDWFRGRSNCAGEEALPICHDVHSEGMQPMCSLAGDQVCPGRMDFLVGVGLHLHPISMLPWRHVDRDHFALCWQGDLWQGEALGHLITVKASLFCLRSLSFCL